METNSLTRQRWFYTGFAIAGVGSLGLMSFPLLVHLPFLEHPAMLFTFVLGLATLMAAGGLLAVFNLKVR